MFVQLFGKRALGAACMSALLGLAAGSACTGGKGKNDASGDAADDDTAAGGSGSPGLSKVLPAPATPGLWRLTPRQYHNALRRLLGSDIALPELKKEQSAGGLAAIAAGTTTATGQDVEGYESLASALAAAAFGNTSTRQAFAGCKTGEPDEACTKTFLGTFGKRAFRRPLSTPELERFVKLANTAKELSGDAWTGLQTAVAGILQSPKFLYRFEQGTPDAKGGRNVLDAYERASRLAFFVTDSLPDDELLAAAEKGDLMNAAGLQQQAKRLWNQNDARKMWRSFIEENYRLDDLDRGAAPASAALLTSMKEEVLRSAESVAFDANTSFLDFFTRRQTFVDPALRSHYGLPGGGSGFALASFPDEQQRVGFFGTAAFLTMTSTALHTSPTARGKFVRERILCEEVPAPMAGVNTSLPPTSPTVRTTRERLELHRQNPECAACHDFMDPPGFAFERFDQVGKYRTTENGADIRTDGHLDPAGKEDAFDGPQQLAELLINQTGTAACLARGLLRQSTGYLHARMDEDKDMALVDGLGAALKDRNFAIESFLMDLVASDVFVTRQSEETL